MKPICNSYTQADDATLRALFAALFAAHFESCEPYDHVQLNVLARPSKGQLHRVEQAERARASHVRWPLERALMCSEYGIETQTSEF